MNATTILALLQTAVTLLTGVQNNPQVSLVTQQQVITYASQVIQQAVQLEVMPTIPFPFPNNNSIWPNVTDLRSTAYIGPDGGYVQLGTNVVLLDSFTSFGDINGDGMDDAVAVVERISSVTGKTQTMLAAMLNQNKIMFNVADAQLPDNMQILSHHVVEGGDIVLNTQIGTAPAQTSTYRLIGDQLIKF